MYFRAIWQVHPHFWPSLLSLCPDLFAPVSPSTWSTRLFLLRWQNDPVFHSQFRCWLYLIRSIFYFTPLNRPILSILTPFLSRLKAWGSHFPDTPWDLRVLHSVFLIPTPRPLLSLPCSFLVSRRAVSPFRGPPSATLQTFVPLWLRGWQFGTQITRLRRRVRPDTFPHRLDS